MKNTKYNKLFAFLITFFLVAGCSSDYLDIEPKGAISMNSFYKTDDDAKGAIYAVYDILQGMNADSWNSMYMLKTLQSDEIYCGGSRRGDYPPYEELNEFRYGSSNMVISKLFELSYWGIYRANLVVENVAPDSPAKKIIIAEAKALRALLYFDLVDLWGKVPLVLVTAKTPSEYNQKRAETSEVWAQLEKDLIDAIPDLPLKSEQKDGNVVRFSKGAAQSTLGKAYLYQKKYAEAASMFKKVIDSNEYGLEADYSRILRYDTEFKVESVFEISYSADKNYDWGTYTWVPRQNESNVHWQLCAPRGDGWYVRGGFGLLAGWGYAYPSQSIYKRFIEAGDSIRRKSSILTESELAVYGGKLRNSAAGNSLPWSCEGFIRLKYGSWIDETSTSSTAVKEVNYGTNIRVIRYADVLLMAAEAFNKSGNDPLAITYLNQVRRRAELPDLSLNGLALFDAIVKERQLELAFEGHRFQDLKRWGLAKSVLAEQGKLIPDGTGTYLSVPDAGFKDKNMLLPIPEQEIAVNPLAKPNNPGY